MNFNWFQLQLVFSLSLLRRGLFSTGQNISVFFILTCRILSSVGVNQPKAIDCGETVPIYATWPPLFVALHTEHRGITAYRAPAESGPSKQMSRISVQADCERTRNMSSALRLILNMNFFTVFLFKGTKMWFVTDKYKWADQWIWMKSYLFKDANWKLSLKTIESSWDFQEGLCLAHQTLLPGCKFYFMANSMGELLELAFMMKRETSIENVSLCPWSRSLFLGRIIFYGEGTVMGRVGFTMVSVGLLR